jgi:alkanesulfonate monooxygenase
VDGDRLSGYPHLEEAYRVAELLFPFLPISIPPTEAVANITGPFGELVANEHHARKQ